MPSLAAPFWIVLLIAHVIATAATATDQSDDFYSTADDVSNRQINFFENTESLPPVTESATTKFLPYKNVTLEREHQKMVDCLERTLAMYKLIGNAIQRRLKILGLKHDGDGQSSSGGIHYFRFGIRAAEISMFDEFLGHLERTVHYQPERPTKRPNGLSWFCHSINNLEVEIQTLIQRTVLDDPDASRGKWWLPWRQLALPLTSWPRLPDRTTWLAWLPLLGFILVQLLILYYCSLVSVRNCLGLAMLNIMLSLSLMGFYMRKQMEHETSGLQYHPDTIELIVQYAVHIFTTILVTLFDLFEQKLGVKLQTVTTWKLLTDPGGCLKSILAITISIILVYYTISIFFRFMTQMASGLGQTMNVQRPELQNQTGAQALPINNYHINNHYNFLPGPMQMDRLFGDPRYRHRLSMNGQMWHDDDDGDDHYQSALEDN